MSPPADAVSTGSHGHRKSGETELRRIDITMDSSDVASGVRPGGTVAHAYVEHAGPSRAYMRDIILGVNDGLVSTFLLVIGVAGGGMETHHILLIGITSAIAGAISMGLGEYLATRSQNQMTDGEIKLEKEHMLYHRDKELAEVREMLRSFKLDGQLLEDATNRIGGDDEALLNFMMATEFGQSEDDMRRPWKAMLVSCCLFFAGSLPSWVPASFLRSPRDLIITSTCLCFTALFAVGAVKGRATRVSVLRSGLENVVLGGLGALVCYGIGSLAGARTAAMA